MIARAPGMDTASTIVPITTVSLRYPILVPYEPLNNQEKLDHALSAAARQDRAAFEIVYDETASMVYGLALRILRSPILAEEVAQEVYLQVWRQASTFDPSRGNARAWISTIAHRRAVDAVRRHQSARDREHSLLSDPPPDDTADVAVDSVERTHVRSALSRLTDLQREVIELAYYGGLTYQQVAERLDTPLGTIKTRMRDGLMRLRSIMEGDHV